MALRDFPILAAADIRSVGLFPYIETQNSKDCTVMLGKFLVLYKPEQTCNGTVKAFLKDHKWLLICDHAMPLTGRFDTKSVVLHFALLVCM